MAYVILSCSLEEASRSRSLAHLARTHLQNAGASVSIFDIRETPLPLFDNSSIYSDSVFRKLHADIESAEGIIFASPVYNWSLSSAAKHIVEGDRRHRRAKSEIGLVR